MFKKNLEEANRDIVDNAFKCNDPSDLQFEEAIGADVAEVRNVDASRAFRQVMVHGLMTMKCQKSQCVTRM